MEYYIYVTNNCNLNCSYCSVLLNAGKTTIPETPVYSLETLVKFVTDVQAKYNDSKADIYFFGGEPTIEYDLIANIIYAFEAISEYQVKFVMHTNGLLLNEAPSDVIDKIDIMLLSLNYEKVFYDNHLSPYFRRIIHNVETVRKIKRFPIIGRITVSPDTSLYTECCLMGNFFDYIYWQLDNSPSVSFDDYQKRYKADISLLFTYWLNFLREGVFLRYVPFISAISNFLWTDTKPSKFYCGYGLSMIYIQTDGSCYACCDEVESKNHYIGNIQSGITFPETDLHRIVCNDCRYIRVCGGRCGRMHKDHTDTRIKEFCQLNKYMFSVVENALPEIKLLISRYPGYQDKFSDPLIAYTEYTP